MRPPKAMQRVFICSPYRAATKEDLARNIAYAKELTANAISEGSAPFTPHLYLPQVISDACVTMRKTGISVGLRFLETCTEIHVGARYGITAGMREEIRHAKRCGIAVRYFDAGNI